MKLYEIADQLEFHIEGDGSVEILGVAGLDEAKSNDISFLSNPRYTSKLKTTRAGAIILDEKNKVETTLPIIRAPDAYIAFAQVLSLFYAPPILSPGIHPTAIIDPSVHIGTNISIGANVVIGESVKIGDRVVIHPNCTIYPNAKIGNDVYIHSNCVIREFVEIGAYSLLQNHVTIGSDGFGYAKQTDGSWLKIVQSGTVILEEHVEIGAGTQIDRASVGETRIKRGTKIDNLVQIGHGSIIGEDTLLCAQVGLAGSSQVGNSVVLAGQVGVAGHLKIGDRVVATAQSGIPNSIPDGKIISGYPAIDNRMWLKSSAIFQKLPELYKTINQLKARLEKLENNSESNS